MDIKHTISVYGPEASLFVVSENINQVAVQKQPTYQIIVIGLTGHGSEDYSVKLMGEVSDMEKLYEDIKLFLKKKNEHHDLIINIDSDGFVVSWTKE